jgi:hypothetical protein
METAVTDWTLYPSSSRPGPRHLVSSDARKLARGYLKEIPTHCLPHCMIFRSRTQVASDVGICVELARSPRILVVTVRFLMCALQYYDFTSLSV